MPRYVLMLLALGLAGCAVPESPPVVSDVENHQSLRIATPGMDGAACTLQTRAGSYTVVSPAVVNVTRSENPLSISCTKGEHFRGFKRVAARRIDTTYAYPGTVNVPMGMNRQSLKVDVNVY